MDIKLNDILVFATGFGVCWLVNKLAKKSEHFGYSAPFAQRVVECASCGIDLPAKEMIHCKKCDDYFCRGCGRCCGC